MTAAKAKPATRQIRRGRGHSYILDGEKVDGVTTVLNNGIPKPALIDWAARTTAGYAVDHWTELGDKTPSVRLKELERARWAKTDEAAARGTEIHAIAHRLSKGEEVDVPEPLEGHVDAYLAFVEDWNVRELLTETVVIKRSPWGSYMGCFDLLADLDGPDGGARWLLDLKTSGSGIFPETAIQVAAYADADTYLDVDDVEKPMPAVDRLGAVWLRADGYDLIPVDGAPDDELPPLAAFAYAQQVARFGSAPRGTYIGEALTRPKIEKESE